MFPNSFLDRVPPFGHTVCVRSCAAFVWEDEEWDLDGGRTDGTQKCLADT